MTAVAQESMPVPGRRSSGSIPKVLIGLAAVAVASLIGLYAWVQWSPPVTHGSTVAGLGDVVTCDPAEFAAEASLVCYEVPFAEGEGVGIGFTVRNTAPIPMTIVRVEAFEPPFVTPAHLYAELTSGGTSPVTDITFGLGLGRPFEPVEVGPNQEVPIQLVGVYLPCEEVARFHAPGSALVIDRARMTVRWGPLETDANIPLGAALSLPAPTSCPGS